MRIDDTPKATSKNLDVLAEYEKAKAKNSANFVVIGMKSLSVRRGVYPLTVSQVTLMLARVH
jgi:hypothetical protein